MDTVEEVLCQVKEKAETLDLEETDLVLDYAIYCKAAEIVMSERNSHLRSFINLRMSSFHVALVSLSVIGKRFADGRLRDLIVESGLLGEDQASPMLKVKDYNNGIRVHLYLTEAINRMKLKAFENWLVTRNEYRIYGEMKENDDVQNLKQSWNIENFEQCVEDIRPLLELYEVFELFFSNPEEYPMAAFWNLYLNMIQTLRDLIKSIKSGNWD